MGLIKDTSQEVKGILNSATTGLLTYGLIAFVAGEYFFNLYSGTDLAWAPLYLLLAVLLYDFVRQR